MKGLLLRHWQQTISLPEFKKCLLKYPTPSIPIKQFASKSPPGPALLLLPHEKAFGENRNKPTPSPPLFLSFDLTPLFAQFLPMQAEGGMGGRDGRRGVASRRAGEMEGGGGEEDDLHLAFSILCIFPFLPLPRLLRNSVAQPASPSPAPLSLLPPPPPSTDRPTKLSKAKQANQPEIRAAAAGGRERGEGV